MLRILGQVLYQHLVDVNTASADEFLARSVPERPATSGEPRLCLHVYSSSATYLFFFLN
jgi:hypothetical protein